MRLDHRVDKMLQGDHPAVRAAMSAAEEAVRSARTKTVPPPPKRAARPGSAPEPDAAPTQARLLHHVALQDAWTPFARAVLGHLASEDATLRLAADMLRGNESLRDEVIAASERHAAEHSTIRQLGAAVRVECALVESARKPVIAALTAFDDATRAQEIEIFPALASKSAMALKHGDTPVPAHYRTSDDIGRALRVARANALAAEPEPELPEERPGCVGQLLMVLRLR